MTVRVATLLLGRMGRVGAEARLVTAVPSLVCSGLTAARSAAADSDDGGGTARRRQLLQQAAPLTLRNEAWAE